MCSHLRKMEPECDIQSTVAQLFTYIKVDLKPRKIVSELQKNVLYFIPGIKKKGSRYCVVAQVNDFVLFRSSDDGAVMYLKEIVNKNV